jgi:hypothetical protein
MNVGLSIFLSAVFLGMVALYIFTRQDRFLWAGCVLLGTVALYVSTKDRWDWKKLVRKTILWSIAVAAGLLTVWGVVFGIYTWKESRPKVQDNFWGIPLGATKADVKFIKGEPTTTEGDAWTYNFSDTSGGYTFTYTYAVVFRKDSVVYIDGLGGRVENLQGIRKDYSTWYDIRKKFGEPTSVSTSDNDLARWFSYAKYQVFFRMSKNKVISLGIYNPRVGIVGGRSEAPDANTPDHNEPTASGG